MDKVKVTIITTVRNGEATIASAIESVLAQTYPNIEHIIIDGASNDSTLAIANEYAEKNKDKIIVSSKKDGGIYYGMNRGLELATGEIIGFLNVDDYFSSDKVIESLVKELEEHPEVDAVYGDVRYVSRNNPERSVRYYSSAGFTRDKTLQGYMPAHPSFYCRRRVYEEFGNYDTNFRVASDFEFILRTIYVGKISVSYVPMECVVMRMGGASNASLRSHYQILRDHLHAYRKHNAPSGFFKDISRYLSKLTEYFVREQRSE